MDIRALLKQGSSLEELEQSLLDLDSEFDFKCRHCGKCCKNQDTVLFTARDIYNIAKKLGKTTEHVIQECGEVSIGYRPGSCWSIWCQLAATSLSIATG